MIGGSIRRREDARFLTGRGRYVDDLRLPEALHLAVVRSVHAHARIVAVDVTRAHETEGVTGIFTLEDLPELRGVLPPPPLAAVSLKPYRQSALADGFVRFAGEPVAAVVASSPYAAADGAAAVAVAYEPLAAAIDPERALAPDAPLVHREWSTNVAAVVGLSSGDADGALRSADLVVTRRFSFGRMSAAPMEPRAVAARWDAVTGTMHLWRRRRSRTSSLSAWPRR
jgi:carbon-monoxide dehydrogenase large subunit